MDRTDSLLITGSSGFVGVSFLDYLASLPVSHIPARIGLISRSGKFQVPQDLRSSSELVFIKADLRAPWNFDFSATKILHLAADGSNSAYSAAAARGFVEMTQNLCNWVGDRPKSTVFHASSGACYGYLPLKTAGTSHDQISVSPIKELFVENRLAGERVMREAHERGLLDLRIGRLFSFIGPHIREKSHYAIPAFVSSALKNHQVVVTGNPATTRSYLDAQDMSDWIYHSFASDVTSDVLDIGSEIPVTIKELAEFVAIRTNSDVIYNNPDGDGDYYVANNHETRSRLGVSESRTWQTSLESYIAFCERAITNEWQ